MAVSIVTLAIGMICLVYGLFGGEAAHVAAPVAAAGFVLLALYGLMGAHIRRIELQLAELGEKLNNREYAVVEELPVRKTRCWGRTRVVSGALAAVKESTSYSKAVNIPH